MFWNGNDYCELCRLPLLPDDKVSLKIPINGKTFIFALHNRDGDDCLQQMIKALSEQLAPTT